MTAPSADVDAREFPFSDRHFQYLRRLAREEAGIELSDAKRELVYGRLARRLRALGLSDFDSYCRLVESPDSDERGNFVNSITTNVTKFFREEHHFDFLRDVAMPKLMERRNQSRRIRMWSAACSTGQEPYSMAMTVASAMPPNSTWDWRILATDIDTNALTRAEAGIYDLTEVEAVTVERERGRWLSQVAGAPGSVQVADEIRNRVFFRSLNLMAPWPMTGPLDIIFCRNVVIYFSEETQRTLFERMHQLMSPDSYLFIGHSESMLHSTDLFQSIGKTVYQPRNRRGQ